MIERPSQKEKAKYLINTDVKILNKIFAIEFSGT